MTERFDGSLTDAATDAATNAASDPCGIGKAARPSSGSALPPSNRRPLRVLLLGDRQDVLDTIKNLHQRGFAPAGEWSRVMACPTADEVMQRVVVSLPADGVVSILTKYLG
ncbi:MAG: hypothetical protein HC881_13070 [Leptolyngbyaceae cyanobacterium SL_7_1]|nr:hypothetical protein [Leptolyngbyaceae cyanobacterium SL_7_1]